jgi:hypothetical protein
MKCHVLVVLAGCSWTGVQGSGTAKSETRNVPAFSAIDIAGPIDAEIAIGSELHVEISGDDNIVPLITSDVSGDRLTIGTRKNVRPSVRLAAKITAPPLTAVDLTGSGDVTVHGLQADHLAVHLTGSGTIRGEGTAHELEVELTGSGDLALDRLAAERVRVTLSGSGDVALADSKALDVSITGSGDVTYHGDPELKQHITGSGRVVKR